MKQIRLSRRTGGFATAALLVATWMGALVAGFWPAAAQTPPIAAWFTDNVAATVITTTVTPLEQALLDRLASATTSIDVAIYDFNRDSVRDALLAAHARGVAVRVVGDNKARGALGSRPNFDALEAAGIPVVVDGTVPTATVALAEIEDGFDALAPAEVQTSLIMHNKYFIVDGRWVWSGSVNMSDSDITLNHNNALDIDSPALAARYQADFDQMFAGSFGTAKLASITDSVALTGAIAHVYFAPQDDPIVQVIDAVNRAERSIDFAIFTFTDDALADALIAAQARGVRVRGLWDSLAAGNAYADDERICAAGAAIKIENTRGLMHNKLLVIDADAPAAVIVTGSLNWTAGGNDGNNENTLVIASASLAGQYAQQYQALWDAIDVAPCNPEGALSWALRLPIVFNDAEAPTPTPLPDATATPTPEPTASITPTVTPTTTPSGTIEGAIHMSRILYDPPGDDVEGEFVEVVNDGGQAADLSGWTLSDDANTPNVYTFGGFALGPGSAVKVWVKAGIDGPGDLYWGRNGAVWNNGGDVARLRNSEGVLIAECPYAPDSGEALCP